MELKGTACKFSRPIADIKLLAPVRHVDSRGFFSEAFKESERNDCEIHGSIVQYNHSWSADKRVIRALHFQIPPFAKQS
jgi:dTDP-4-dehydrorhamnose 3,5-epimerase